MGYLRESVGMEVLTRHHLDAILDEMKELGIITYLLIGVRIAVARKAEGTALGPRQNMLCWN